MAVNHETPKCPKCKRYMTLNGTKEGHAGNTEYIYVCDNPNCTHQREIAVLEPSN